MTGSSSESFEKSHTKDVPEGGHTSALQRDASIADPLNRGLGLPAKPESSAPVDGHLLVPPISNLLPSKEGPAAKAPVRVAGRIDLTAASADEEPAETAQITHKAFNLDAKRREEAANPDRLKDAETTAHSIDGPDENARRVTARMNKEKAILHVLPPLTSLDPNRPTVAFLDDFRDQVAEFGPSHGDVSAYAAAETGPYNVIRVEEKQGEVPYVPHSLRADWSVPLQEIARRVESGALPLSRGDVLNISLGNGSSLRGLPPETWKQPWNEKNRRGDPTFAEASKMLGFEVTPENLSEKRPEILQKLKEIAREPAKADPDGQFQKDWARSLVSSNDAIARLQAKGIMVMQAAGNEGDKKFSIDFLAAERQMSALGLNGSLFYQNENQSSANHSLTTPNLGVLRQSHDCYKPDAFNFSGRTAGGNFVSFWLPADQNYKLKNPKSSCPRKVLEGTSYVNTFELRDIYEQRLKMKNGH